MNDLIDMLYIEYTKKCNSKCSTCDYWLNKKEELVVSDKEIIDLIRELKDLKVVLFTGGEALLRAKDLFQLAKKIKDEFPNIELRLLSNGLLVNNYLDEIVKYFDTVVYSFDACNKEMYKNIRGIDAFDIVVDSIRNIKKNNLNIRLRCMVLEKNYRYLDKIIELAKDLKVNQISFIPVDTESTIAFERKSKKTSIKNNINIEELESIINNILSNKELIESNVLTENGDNLRNVIKFYKNEIDFKECNSPASSIVLQMDGSLKTCFFTNPISNIHDNDILTILNSKEFIDIRKRAKCRKLKECKECIL